MQSVVSKLSWNFRQLSSMCRKLHFLRRCPNLSVKFLRPRRRNSSDRLKSLPLKTLSPRRHRVQWGNLTTEDTKEQRGNQGNFCLFVFLGLPLCPLWLTVVSSVVNVLFFLALVGEISVGESS